MSGAGDDGVEVEMPPGFSLGRTCAPAFWVSGRWPHEDWREGAYWWVGREGGAVAWRRVGPVPGGVRVEGTGDPTRFGEWAMRVLRPRGEPDRWTDPVIAGLERRYPGMGLLNSGNLLDGAVTSIVGQSISLASCGAALTRIAANFAEPIRLAGRDFLALPSARELAESPVDVLRSSGVTRVRAEALVAVGSLFLRAEESGAGEPEVSAMAAIRGVGPWTVASTRLWGAGDPAVHPRNDAALLRAARLAYRRPDLGHPELDALADGWDGRPAVAARLLWLAMFGQPR